jgi:hypothetical protein
MLSARYFFYGIAALFCFLIFNVPFSSSNAMSEPWIKVAENHGMQFFVRSVVKNGNFRISSQLAISKEGGRVEAINQMDCKNYRVRERIMEDGTFQDWTRWIPIYPNTPGAKIRRFVCEK